MDFAIEPETDRDSVRDGRAVGGREAGDARQREKLAHAVFAEGLEAIVLHRVLLRLPPGRNGRCTPWIVSPAHGLSLSPSLAERQVSTGPPLSLHRKIEA